jgi:methylmalonyl-CoA/ethylmalonyl-CoA epimerase
MANVTELRIALTVQDFGQALAFYRDALGLEQLADWSSESGRVVVLEAGRATLELFDDAQAEAVDAIEAGRRVSGTVRLAMQVADSNDMAQRLVAAGAVQVAPPVVTPGVTAMPGSRRRTGCSSRCSPRSRRAQRGHRVHRHRRGRQLSWRLVDTVADHLPGTGSACNS